jgi:hypothetical protein
MIKSLPINTIFYIGAAIGIFYFMTSFFPYLALAAPLSVFTSLSSNIVNTNSSYQIEFTTATNGTIKTIDIGFPDNYNTQFAKLIETSGIGPGSLSVNSGMSPYTSTIQYTVNYPVTIPNDTYIKLKISNITNPNMARDDYTLLITTKDTANNIIDGPSKTKTFIIKG